MADDDKNQNATNEEHHSKAKGAAIGAAVGDAVAGKTGAVIGGVIGAEHQPHKNEDEKDGK
jgi:outer membrane lipoprotein SlyB